jgi:HEAT repeat protein
MTAGATVGVPPEARALSWPDVAERVERDLAVADPATRRTAARDLAKLGPARGGPLALQALQDPDAEVRVAAADAAIHLRTAGATDTVAAWLNAPDARLRRKACEVASALPSPRAVAPLARTLGDPDPDVRAAAADALAHQASPDAVAPLLGRLDDPAPAVRQRIVAALAALADPRAVVPLVGKVQDSSPEVREAVARALGDLGDARASSALVVALRDQNVDVRRDALVALGHMRAADAVDAIAPLTQDRISSLRLAALAALGHIGSEDAVRVLLGALGVADDAGGGLERTPVRDALVSAGPAAVPALHALFLGSPSPAAATSAAWLLGQLHAQTEAPAIVAAMRRGVVPTSAALRALSGAGTPAEVPVVLEFVADPNPAVRTEALRAAGALLNPNHPDGRAVEPLAAALRDAQPSLPERAWLATLLGRTGAWRAAPLLGDLATARDLGLRLAAIDALGLLGRENTTGAPASSPDLAIGAEKALLDALASAEPAVRLHAAIALGDIAGAHARDVLLAKLERGEQDDRSAVLTALGGVLTRTPSDAAVAKLVSTLELSGGPERDAVVDAFGRAPLASAVRALDAVARADRRAPRRAAAAALALHPAEPAAVAVLRRLLGDSDPSVRAEAVWSLGLVGDASDVPRLAALADSEARATSNTERPLARPAASHAALAGDNLDAACNAPAAIGRIAARAHDAAAASKVLCPYLASVRPYVRANALAGLAAAGARCEEGGPERARLVSDPSEDVRAAAARLLSSSSNPEDLRALERCARSDPSTGVAARCAGENRGTGGGTPRSHVTTIYVFGEGDPQPTPAAPFALLLADGAIHVGTADRRGAVFEAAAPEGEMSLRRPSALAR